MPERIYNVNPDGGLEPMVEQPFALEDDLQELLAKYPELLDGEQVRPDNPRRWILISREMGIAERLDESPRWSLDHLIVDQDAVPTLVEVKRSANTEIRRTIVGQLLEYAAHASETWTAVTMGERFVASCEKLGDDPTASLARLLQTDDADVDAFFQDVATNLAARRMRLLFVADEIPDPLLRIVEFLNQQMPTIEVLAVEIKQYSGTARRTLVPRVMGRIAGTSPDPRPPRLTRESFLNAFPDAAQGEVAAHLLKVAEDAGASLTWGSNSVSIRVSCAQWGFNLVTVGWLTPPGITGWMGLRALTLGEAISGYGEPKGPELGSVLEGWVEWLSQTGYLSEIPTKGMRIWTAGYARADQHFAEIAEMLATVVRELRALE